jgi:MoxR-like ATPase
MILATQNPVELEGTFPLPEAQLDRFLFKVSLGYPTEGEEVNILKRFKAKDPLQELRPVVDAQEIVDSRAVLEKVKIDDELLNYITRLSEASRESEFLRLGLSPRASLLLMKASLAYAYVKGRDFVLPDDIKYLFPYVAEHRLILTHEHEARGMDKLEVMEDIMSAVEVPVEEGLRE